MKIKKPGDYKINMNELLRNSISTNQTIPLTICLLPIPF